MIAVLFVALIILISANLAWAAISGFWADCGQAIVTECHAAGQKYPAKQLVKSFLTQGLDGTFCSASWPTLRFASWP